LEGDSRFPHRSRFGEKLALLLPAQGIRLDSGGLAWPGKVGSYCPRIEISVGAAAWRRKKERENSGKKKKIRREKRKKKKLGKIFNSEFFLEKNK
jgi:hypothetical protein